MILQALTAYYEQLLAQGKVEAPGWDSRFKVSYELRLGPDGQLLALNDLRQEVPKGKKTVIAPRELPVPHRVKRASGVAANFLCDNTSYLLGADEKGKPERSRQCFEACAALHHKVLDGVDSPAAKAILAFFDSWEPDTAPTHPLLAEQWADLNNNANLVFGYESPDGAHWLATTDDAIRAAWQSAFDTSDADAETARCLITGKEAGIARIHPAIKGVMGAQPPVRRWSPSTRLLSAPMAMSRVPTPLSASTRLSPTPRPSICCWPTGTAVSASATPPSSAGPKTPLPPTQTPC